MGYHPKVHHDGPDKLAVESGGEIDFKSGSSLKLDGTAVTATAAEINAIAGGGLSATELGFLNGAVAGTVAADKAVVAGTGKVVDEIDITLLKVGGVNKTAAVAAAVATPVAGVAAGYKVARGQHTTVDADDTVATGLATVVSAVAVLEDDPVAGVTSVTCVIGDQAGAPAAGSIQIKSWKPTAAGDTAPTAATTFSKKVNWIAVGT